MNKIIKEDFEKILSAYGDQFEKLRNCTILVTGATGMISTYLSEFLIYISDSHNLQLYLQFRNTAKAKKLFKENLDNNNIHLTNFDFENNEIPDIRFDYILHAASPASTTAFEKIPVDVISPNVIGTWYLMQHARKKGILKFLIFSSGSVYGQSETEKASIGEEDYGVIDPLWYRSCYVESKRLSEQMGMAFWKQYNVPSSFVRICHTYGPTFDLEKDLRIVPRIIKQILNEEDITIYKDPNSVAQYTYVADIISAVLLVLLNGEPGGAYNACGDDIVKIDDVIDWMVNADPSICSKLIEKEIDENYKFGKNSGTVFPKFSNHKLTELGWHQLYTPKDGFSRMVRYYMENNVKTGGVGLGTGELDKERLEDMAALLVQAILCGYRVIDTAYSYGTEKIVGIALKLLFDAGMQRDEIFIQTKFYPVMPYDGGSVREQFEESLQNLGINYVDSYLIHQPVPRYSELEYTERNISVWKEMKKLASEGKIKHIGVSNFLERHIIQLIEASDTVPEINQLEINPQFQQRGLAEFCKKNGITVQSWGPLTVTEEKVKTALQLIADKYGVSQAQVALKWNIQSGNTPICFSKNIQHLIENLRLDFELSKEDMETIRMCNSATAHRETWWYPRQQMY